MKRWLDGNGGVAAVVSIRRDEGSLSEVGTNSLWALNQEWLGVSVRTGIEGPIVAADAGPRCIL